MLGQEQQRPQGLLSTPPKASAHVKVSRLTGPTQKSRGRKQMPGQTQLHPVLSLPLNTSSLQGTVTPF